MADRREYAHTKATFWCAQRWAKMSRALAAMSATLRELELDFANSFCPGDCCRIVDLVDFGFVGHLEPKIVTVVGLRQGEDVVVRRQIRLAFLMARRCIARLLYCAIPLGILGQGGRSKREALASEVRSMFRHM